MFETHFYLVWEYVDHEAKTRVTKAEGKWLWIHWGLNKMEDNNTDDNFKIIFLNEKNCIRIQVSAEICPPRFFNWQSVSIGSHNGLLRQENKSLFN